MVKYATDNFQKLDTSGNGFINDKELDAGAAKATGKEREYLLALKSHVWELAKLSSDEWGPEWSGISRNDLARLGKLADWMPDDVAAANAVRRIGLAKWEQLSGGDNRIRHYLLDTGIARASLGSTPCELEELYLLRKRYYDASHSHGKVLSVAKEDLEDYPRAVRYGYRMIYQLSPGSK